MKTLLAVAAVALTAGCGKGAPSHGPELEEVAGPAGTLTFVASATGYDGAWAFVTEPPQKGTATPTDDEIVISLASGEPCFQLWGVEDNGTPTDTILVCPAAQDSLR